MYFSEKPGDALTTLQDVQNVGPTPCDCAQRTKISISKLFPASIQANSNATSFITVLRKVLENM